MSLPVTFVSPDPQHGNLEPSILSVDVHPPGIIVCFDDTNQPREALL